MQKTDRVARPHHDAAENPWIEALKTIGLSIVLALGIRTYVAEARYIPSESMVPTLEVNDRLIVEKLHYNFGANPQRGEIIVFSPNQELESRQFKDAMIKRVIGLPGDRVELRQGRVFVNGQALNESYVARQNQRSQTTLAQAGAAIAAPPDRNQATSQPISALPQATDTSVCLTEMPYLKGVVVVPANSYLVLGDNRKRSYDSRCWGVVPRDHVIGHAIWRFWPLDRLGSL